MVIEASRQKLFLPRRRRNVQSSASHNATLARNPQALASPAAMAITFRRQESAQFVRLLATEKISTALSLQSVPQPELQSVKSSPVMLVAGFAKARPVPTA